MNLEHGKDNDASGDALQGAIGPTFFKYLIPSLVGLLAMTSALLVDGFFIGNYVGITALAAVNLIVPINAILLGVGIMLAIGGSVRGGKYLGEGNTSAASAIFSKTMVAVTIYGIVVIALGLAFERQLFIGLGATEALMPVMSEYFRIILPFLLSQFIGVTLYFFTRLDGLPVLAAAALGSGAIMNVILDYLFIAVYDWGLTGAAFATGFSQTLPLLVMGFYFFWPKRRLRLSFRQKNWREVFQAAYNGVSEFISEISGGIITFILNWMMIQRGGVDGVAAITVVNYLLLTGYMVFFAVSDTIQVLTSQNFGARRIDRIEGFLKAALGFIATVTAIIILVLTNLSEPLISVFVDEKNSDVMIHMATELVTYVWPLFVFSGVNMLISGYLTSIHLPFQSGVVSLCRSFIFPAGLLILFYWLLTDYQFVAALSVAEALTFALALAMFLNHTPSKATAAAFQS
jgi:Na+-driven multidrug efflux pump